jgi:hypothetical protein
VCEINSRASFVRSGAAAFERNLSLEPIWRFGPKRTKQAFDIVIFSVGTALA